MGKGKGRSCQGTCIKDPWTKPKRKRIEGGRWGGAGESGSGKMETAVLEQQQQKKINLNHLCKDLMSYYCRIVRYWRLGLQNMN